MPTTITLTTAHDPVTNINVGDYIDEGLSISNRQTGSSAINLNNPSGITKQFKIGINFQTNLTDFTLNTESGTNVLITAMYKASGSPDLITLNIGTGSSLSVAHPLNLPSGVPTNINFSEGSSFEIKQSSPWLYSLGTIPNLSGLSIGNKIVIQGTTRVEYNEDNLIFYDQGGFAIAHFKVEGLIEADIIFDATTGTMSYACYLKGTHIATPYGETKVEDLQAGDTVLTASGGIATVKWIGYRTLYKSQIPTKDAIRAFPITFAKSAIAPNIPHRDLTMSPGHHVLFDSKLIPAMLLVNGKTITQDFTRTVFEYFHVELEQFAILLAEGVPAESYVDTGNRSMFQNAHTVAMCPDFGPQKGRPDLPGIEVVRGGPAVEAIRKRLLKRAEAMTNSIRVSDPDLRIEVNGQEIYPEISGQTEGVMRFILPVDAPVSSLRIVSRCAVVRDTTTHPRRDLRNVGIGLARITLEDDNGRREIDINDAHISGLHNAQEVNGVAMRWTNGAAVIPAFLLNRSGQAVLELYVLRTYSYWEPARRAA